MTSALALDPPAYAKDPLFRVQSYTVVSNAAWTGFDYDLELDFDLEPNYFVIIQPTCNTTANTGPAPIAARVTHDPFGTGALSVSTGPRVIRLHRDGNAYSWQGTITVVECLNAKSASGFRLEGVININLGPFGPSGVQDIGAPTGLADITRIVPMGGLYFGGMSSSETANDRWPTVTCSFELPDPTLHVRRWGNGGGSVQNAMGSVYLVRWGSDWTVQDVKITTGAPVGGADLNVPGEFATAAISSVVRARTMLVSYGITVNTQPNGMVLTTLGDGVNENAAESTVAAGVWAPDNLEAHFWVLTHDSLSVDWTPTQSTSSVGPLSVGAPPPKGDEGYRYDEPPRMSWGRRAVLLSNSAEMMVAGAMTEALLYARIVNDSSVVEVWRRDNSVDNIVGWVQVVDFAAVRAVTETTDSPGPIQGIVLPDLEMTGESILSVSSLSGFRLGPVVPETGNAGRMLAFHSGDPTADLELTYRITRHGDLGEAGWVWQDATDPTSWYGWNAYDFLHQSHPFNGQTSARYGFCPFYSAAYDRVVGGYFTTTVDTSLTFYARSQDGPAFGYTSIGSVELDNDLTSPATGGGAHVKVRELDDGSLRLVALVTDPDGNYDFDVWGSTDGGASWRRLATRILWRANGGTALGAAPINVDFAVSGDWMRLIWTDSSLAQVWTMVSSIRGTTWEYLGAGSSPISVGTNSLTFEYLPVCIVGIPDGAGTFIMWVRNSSNGRYADAYVASRSDEWVQDTDLGVTFTSNYLVEQLAACYAPDGIFLLAQTDRSATGEVAYRLTVFDADNPQAGGTTLGLPSTGPGFGRLPYQLHLLNGGRELLLAANAVDFSGAMASGIFVARLAGWSQHPVQSPDISGSSQTYHWSSVWSDTPSSGTYKVWAGFSSGATISTTRARMKVTTGAGQYAYWEFSPSTTGNWNGDGLDKGVGCGGILRVPSSATETVDRNVGVRIRAQGAGASGASLMLTATSSTISLWDLVASSKIGSISAASLGTSWWEFRLGLHDNTQAFLAARPLEDSDDWTVREDAWEVVSGTLNLSAGITLDLLHFGNLTYSGAGSNESDWRELWVCSSYGHLLQAAGVSWSDFLGRLTTSRPQRVHSGVDVLWGGGSAARRDSFTGIVGSAYPAEAIFTDSPSFYWQASDDGAQEIVFDFGAGDADDATQRRALHEAALLVGTRARYATVEYNQENVWTDPSASFTLDATIQEGVRVLAHEGHSVLVEYPSLPETAASLAGSYFRVTAAATLSAEGTTWKIRKHGHPSQEAGVSRAWLYLESAGLTNELAAYNIQAGDTACLFADRMAVLYGESVKTRYMRVSWASEVVAPTRKHALGAIVAGPFHQFDPPLDWTWKDNEQPNTTRFSAKSGVTWAKREGPAQRTWEARLVGDYSQRSRESLRDLLRLFADYDVRPVGLLTQISGSRPLPQASLYGYVSTGGQLDNEGWWKDEDGTWRAAGDASLQLVEVR